MSAVSCWSVAVVVGLVVSLLFGHFFAKLTRDGLYRVADVQEPTGKRVPGWVVGLIERSIFLVLASAAAWQSYSRVLDLAMPAMFWIGLKMAVHWQVPMSLADDEERKAGIPASRAMAAIMGGAVSILMAGLGGVIVVAIVRAC